jgi:hypothetical protein
MGIGSLVRNRSFATRDEELIKDLPGAIATNVLTFIDRLDRRLLPGLRAHYDFLSERCHPNSMGHHQLFGKRDRETNVTSYSDTHDPEGHLNHILAAATLLRFVEACMDRLDAAIPAIAEQQF